VRDEITGEDSVSAALASVDAKADRGEILAVGENSILDRLVSLAVTSRRSILVREPTLCMALARLRRRG
jgi:hypothetical protein